MCCLAGLDESALPVLAARVSLTFALVQTVVKPADHSQQGSGGGGGGSSSSLLDQIRAGKELRSVDDQSALPSIETPQGQTLVDTLARALNNRRVNMMQDEEAPEGDDDWFEDDSDEDW